MPSKILLCGGGSALPEIKQVLEEDEWIKGLPFAKKPNVIFITPSDVGRIVNDNQEINEPKDVTPLCLVNVAIDLIGKETIAGGIVTKLIQSLRS